MDCFIILTCSRKSRSKFLWPVDSSLRDWAAMPIFFFNPSLFTQSDWKLSESIIPITHTWAEPTWMQIHLAFTHPIKFAFWALWLACFLQAQSNGVYYFVSPAWPVASSVRQGKKEGLVKATVRSRAQLRFPRAQALHVCAGEGLLNVPSAAGWLMGQRTPAFPPKGSSCSYWQEVLLTKVVSNWQGEHIQLWGVPHTHFFMGISCVNKGTVCSVLNMLFYLSRQRNNCMRKVNIQ